MPERRHCESGGLTVSWYRSSYSGCNGNCVEVWRKSSYSGAGNCLEAAFRTSSYSANGNCAEAALRGGVVLVRDSKLVQPDGSYTGAVLNFTPAAWAAFTAGVKAGTVGAAG